MAALQKVALVTGAGTGIGKAVALALMKEGYAAVLAGRRKDKLEETASEGKSTGAKTLAVPTDIGDPAAIKALFAKTKETFSRLDVLFNNAGIGAPAVSLEDLPYETWKQVVDVNLARLPRLQHHLQPNRYRQCRNAPHGAHGARARRDAGGRPHGDRAAHECGR